MNARTIILNLIDQQGSSQRALAELLEVSPQALSRALNTEPELRGIWGKLLEHFKLDITLIPNDGAASDQTSDRASSTETIPTALEAAALATENIMSRNDRHRSGVLRAINEAINNEEFIAVYPHVISDSLAEELTGLGYLLDQDRINDDDEAEQTIIFFGPADKDASSRHNEDHYSNADECLGHKHRFAKDKREVPWAHENQYRRGFFAGYHTALGLITDAGHALPPEVDTRVQDVSLSLRTWRNCFPGLDMMIGAPGTAMNHRVIGNIAEERNVPFDLF